VSNDGLRHEMTEVLALVQEQMADIAAMQKRQAEITAKATVADGMVEVTVDAHGHLVETIIDESYLDEHEFEELADHVTEAAQAAVREVSRRIAELMVPISERRKRFPSLSEFIDGAPDLRDLVPPGFGPVNEPGPRPDHVDGDGREENTFPTVRR
jgi:DNA-binding protein YbaB